MDNIRRLHAIGEITIPGLMDEVRRPSTEDEWLVVLESVVAHVWGTRESAIEWARAQHLSFYKKYSDARDVEGRRASSTLEVLDSFNGLHHRIGTRLDAALKHYSELKRRRRASLREEDTDT